ncbi:unnamed protein product, partial [Brenthis ino]
MSTVKQFEKKLNKLQDDVNYHGQTLSQVHVMLANMSGGTMLNNINDTKLDVKRYVNKMTAMHHEANHDKTKTKRRNLQPLAPKITAKSFQIDKYGINTSDSPNARMIKSSSNPKNFFNGKRLKQRNGEAPRKATTLRKKMQIND